MASEPTRTAESTPATHTPGPWSIHEDSDLTARHICAPNEAESLIAQVSTWKRGSLKEKTEAVANTYLIAAAPDLLTALKGLLNECAMHGCFEHVSFDHPSVKPAFDAARAAVAKAEGRS